MEIARDHIEPYRSVVSLRLDPQHTTSCDCLSPSHQGVGTCEGRNLIHHAAIDARRSFAPQPKDASEIILRVLSDEIGSSQEECSPQA